MSGLSQTRRGTERGEIRTGTDLAHKTEICFFVLQMMKRGQHWKLGLGCRAGGTGGRSMTSG